MLALVIVSSAYVNAQETADFAQWMQDLLEIQVGKDPKKIREFIKSQGSCSGEIPYLLMKSGADDLHYPTNDFCNKPFQAICGSLKYNSAAKQKRYVQFNEEIERKATEDITRKRGPRPKEKEKREGWDSRYSDILENHRRAKLFSTTTYHVTKNVQPLQTYFLNLIESKLRHDPNKNEMRRIILKTKILNFGDVYFNTDTLSEAERKEVAADADRECGDGLYSNSKKMKRAAFSSRVGSTPYVFICPRWLIENIESSPYGADFDFEMFQVLSHEIAHHINSKKYDDAYAKYKACLIQYHADDILTVKPQSSQEKVEQRLSEITADYWAIQAIKLYFKEHVFANKLDVLRKAYSSLCPENEAEPARDDDGHPDSHFRIENLLRSDPAIAEYMLCKPVKTGKPGCTINGASEYSVY